jgi:hypothetical protein
VICSATEADLCNRAARSGEAEEACPRDEGEANCNWAGWMTGILVGWTMIRWSLFWRILPRDTAPLPLAATERDVFYAIPIKLDLLHAVRFPGPAGSISKHLYPQAANLTKSNLIFFIAVSKGTTKTCLQKFQRFKPAIRTFFSLTGCSQNLASNRSSER